MSSTQVRTVTALSLLAAAMATATAAGQQPTEPSGALTDLLDGVPGITNATELKNSARRVDSIIETNAAIAKCLAFIGERSPDGNGYAHDVESCATQITDFVRVLNTAAGELLTMRETPGVRAMFTEKAKRNLNGTQVVDALLGIGKTDAKAIRDDRKGK